MNLTNRSKILISVVGLIAILGVVAQATGVLAAWNDKVWGSTTFSRAAALDGYARSITAHAKNQRLITGGEFTVNSATHTYQSAGTTWSPNQSDWVLNYNSGFAGVGLVAARGRSFAEFTRNGGNIEGAAKSWAKEVKAIPAPSLINPLNSALSVLDTRTSEFYAEVDCKSTDYGGNVTPRAVAPTGNGIYLGIESNNRIPVPAANAAPTVIDDNAVGYHVDGVFQSIAVATGKRALSTLVLHLDVKTLITRTPVWEITIQLVRAECAVGEPLPSATQTVAAGAAARMAALAPTSESTTPSESAESSAAESSESESSASSSTEKSPSESSSSASSSESEAAETPVLKQGPTTPTDVDVGERFPVTATDGTDLGTATIQKVESTAPSDGAPATVAVKMSVTTSDADDDGRLSSIDWGDFAPMVGGVQQAPGRAPNEGPELPDQLTPGQTYTGWVTFTAPGAAGKAIWKPEGTAGFTFVLPDPEVPVTSTTSTPAPIANAPETSEPEAAPTEDAPAAESPAAEAEDSDPVPTPEKKSRARSSSSESASDPSDEE
ncbi:hypothetical protein [Gordonia metallireducens]|uniref:hypothetical protein n=1 Tax=Gordonia metallireducens TaxID=2897779 RepID=UPI001E389A46|nr:hypothetical protein [Gordonia metallireducens]